MNDAQEPKIIIEGPSQQSIWLSLPVRGENFRCTLELNAYYMTRKILKQIVNEDFGNIVFRNQPHIVTCDSEWFCIETRNGKNYVKVPTSKLIDAILEQDEDVREYYAESRVNNIKG